MKKTYITPSATLIRLTTEGMMAQSLDYSTSDTEHVTEEGNILSTGKGWSSDNWTSTDED